MAVVVEPKEDHDREKVAQMEGGSGGINASVDADLFRLEDFVEDISVAILRVSNAMIHTRAIHTTATDPAISLM